MNFNSTPAIKEENEVVAAEEQLPLPSALATVAQHLQTAVGGNADVVSLELSVERGTAKLKFYAYRHAKPTASGS
jgi:hypothetical protein